MGLTNHFIVLGFKSHKLIKKPKKEESAYNSSSQVKAPRQKVNY